MMNKSKNQILKNSLERFVKRNNKVTTLRKKILEIIINHQKPIKAYDIIDALHKEGYSDKPTIVYRILNLFLQQKIIHKLNTTNEFIICTDNYEKHNCYFLICTNCNNAQEICNSKLDQKLENIAIENNFIAINNVIEIEGICEDCV